MTIIDQQRYANAVVGLAAGDAWGYQVEFTPFAKMTTRPVSAPAKVWRISDDTQMTLALHRALAEAQEHYDDVFATTETIIEHFLRWQVDPDNNRAPGRSCMGSLKRLRAGAWWFNEDGAVASGGCGAVMRLAPAAFAPEQYWLGLTALQAVVTHRHPRAVVSALLVADAMRHADRCAGAMLERATIAAMDLYDGTSAWLDDPYLKEVLAPMSGDVSSLLVNGLDDRVIDGLLDATDQRARHLAEPGVPVGDPCEGIGAGWESATAIALAMLVADVGARRIGPRSAMAWAATSDGDSDSIASIAGALIGAGSAIVDFWPVNGVSPRFEKRYTREIAAASGRAA